MRNYLKLSLLALLGATALFAFYRTTEAVVASNQKVVSKIDQQRGQQVSAPVSSAVDPSRVEHVGLEQDVESDSVLKLNVPFVQVYDELVSKASNGDKHAACAVGRYSVACRRYGMFLNGNGRMGPYEKAGSAAEIAALDDHLFGMSMERAARICAGYSHRPSDPLPKAAVLTSRNIPGHGIATLAALELHRRYGYDPENLRVITDRAASGDVQALQILVHEPSNEPSLYQGLNELQRNVRSLKWLLIRQQIEPDTKNLVRIDAMIKKHSATLSFDAFNKIQREAGEIFHNSYRPGQLGPDRDRAIFSLDNSYCEQ